MNKVLKEKNLFMENQREVIVNDNDEKDKTIK